MKSLIIIIVWATFLYSCSDNNGQNRSFTDTLKKVDIKPTNVFKDIDTSINLKLYNLSPYERSISKAQKKKIIETAIRSALPITAYRYLELNCWKLSEKTKEPYEDSTTKAPECRLNDFYLIDIDNDGDLDILYSSLVDQYVQGDTNYLLLLQNNNGHYKSFDIPGYLYDADFSQLLKGNLIFKTASRPCCDYSNYNFFETYFDARTWTLITKHILEIHKSKVHES